MLLVHIIKHNFSSISRLLMSPTGGIAEPEDLCEASAEAAKSLILDLEAAITDHKIILSACKH